MNKQPNYVFLFIWLGIWLFSSCRDKECSDASNPECLNYNPCLSITKSNAAFVIVDSMLPYFGINLAGFVVDTIWTPARLYFRGMHKNATYEWKIGTDDRTFAEKEFELFFDTDASGNIPVRLITKDKPQPDCFPNDDGIDTFFQSVFLMNYYDNFEKIPIVGKFKGYEESQKDSLYTIEIYTNIAGDWGLFHFPECTESPSWTYLKLFPSWRNFLIELETGCHFIEGRGTLQADNKTLIIDYNTQAFYQAPIIKKRFIGIKQ